VYAWSGRTLRANKWRILPITLAAVVALNPGVLNFGASLQNDSDLTVLTGRRRSCKPHEVEISVTFRFAFNCADTADRVLSQLSRENVSLGFALPALRGSRPSNTSHTSNTNCMK
jgi:hypothetical protein